MLKILLLICFFIKPRVYAKSNNPEDWFLFNIIPKSWITYLYRAPDINSLPNSKISDEIKYGYELIQNTSYYIGPNGKAGSYLGNKLNCASCHMEAGTRLFGGTFQSTHTNYPQYRDRENVVISLADRINACILRPHNGKALPEDSREMRAMLMYMKWLGEGEVVGTKSFGGRLMDLAYLDRAASPDKGKIVFEKNCVRCHGENGQGQLKEDGISYTYPPLWGPDSYGVGSSMHRVTAAASFIKNNMPFGTTWESPVLTDEEAYDVAAFINDDRIHPRTAHDVSKDYQDLYEKPIDYPVGPYIDSFSEEQHKFGPYWPIKNEISRLKKAR